MRRPPRQSGVARARWTLAALAGAVVWLGALSSSGAHALARRLGVRWRRGQAAVHSPDPEYEAKLAAVAEARRRAGAEPGRVVLLYEDELTYYRRPSVAPAWEARGGPGRRARQGLRPNTKRRVLGALDCRDGRLHCLQRSRAGVDALVRFLRALEAAYPDAEEVYVALDNWPVHFHPDVLAALGGSGVRLLRLPTYAPWTNPVEKVWRRLKQEVLHQHDFADDWMGLQDAVTAWLDRWPTPSQDLLRYCGLAPE